MAKIKVVKDLPFSTPNTYFTLGHSSSGYTLMYSANYNKATGEGDWDELAEVPSNKQCTVECPLHCAWMKCEGNMEEIDCTYDSFV